MKTHLESVDLKVIEDEIDKTIQMAFESVINSIKEKLEEQASKTVEERLEEE